MSKNINEKLLSFEDIDSENKDLENLNKLTKYNYFPKDHNELLILVRNLMKERGFNADLNDICTSQITDMSYMFSSSMFNGDISKWDVSNVEDMAYMFAIARAFNGDISNWDVSKVKNMTCMFGYSDFNGDISKWNVSNVETMSYMFYRSSFNGDISNWNVSNVENMSDIFAYSLFNGDISKWNINHNCNIYNANFPRKRKVNEKLLSFEDIDSKDNDLENLNEITEIAERKKWLEEFKRPNSKGINLHSFLDYYLTSHHTEDCEKYELYEDNKADKVYINKLNYKPLADETGEYIFNSASMWYYDGFGFFIEHRPSKFPPRNKENFVNFNGKLFFKKDIYTLKKVIYCTDDENIFVCFKPLKETNDYVVSQNGDIYSFLPRYNVYSLNSEHSTSKEFLSMFEKTSLNVSDEDFLHKLKLLETKEMNEKLLSFEDTESESNDLEKLNKLTKYNYYPKTREELYTIIRKLIKERGNNADLNDIYTGDITDMSGIFYWSKFNVDISEWDVSNVEDMSYVFAGSKFNGDISNWNVSNVKDMKAMFRYSSFNGDISKWNVSNVEDMKFMFSSSKFNGDISNWDVSKVKDMAYMFYDSPFDGDVSNWNINPKCNIKNAYLNANFPKKRKVNEKLLSFEDKESKDNDLENLNNIDNVLARKKEFEENWEYLGDERYECNDLYRRVAKYKKIGGARLLDTCNFLINNGSYELLFPLTNEYQFHNVTRFVYLGPKYNLYAARVSRIIKDENDPLRIRPKGGVAFFEYNIIFNDGTFLFPEWVSKYYILPDIAMDKIGQTEEPFFNIRSTEANTTFRFYFNGDIVDVSHIPWVKLPKDMTIEEYCRQKFL